MSRLAPAGADPSLTLSAALARGRSRLLLGDRETGLALLESATRMGNSRAERVAATIAAAELDPDIQGWLAEAEVARLAGDVMRLRVAYGLALERYPAHPEMNLELGRALLGEQNYQQAEIHLRNAVALGIPVDAIHAQVGDCMRHAGVDGPVIPSIGKAASTARRRADDPRHPDAYALPDLETIQTFQALLLDEPGGLNPLHTLRAQRASANAVQLVAWFIQTDEFSYTNIEFLDVYKASLTRSAATGAA